MYFICPCYNLFIIVEDVGDGMGLFDKIFKKKEPEVVKVIIPPTNRSEINLNLPDGELVPFEGDILNTASMENIAIFKHNLGVLISKTKSAGKVENPDIHIIPIDLRADNMFDMEEIDGETVASDSVTPEEMTIFLKIGNGELLVVQQSWKNIFLVYL